MKPIISTIGFAMIIACVCAQTQGADKTFYSSGQILPGDAWDSVVIRNDNTVVDMLGGRIGRLNTSDGLFIYDDSLFNMSQGQITVSYISIGFIGSSSTINISGGTTDIFTDFVFREGSYGLISGGSLTARRLKMYYDSKIDIRGGFLQINDIDMVESGELPTVNIYGHGFNYSGDVLSGYLVDGNPFSIGGVDELEYSLFNLIFEHRVAELLVPTQYPTIQSAIDAAADGDTVIVAPGTYTGPGNRDIDFIGKALTVRSINPGDPNIVSSTIIDCNGTKSEFHRGFYFHNGEGGNSILTGLTITNSYVGPLPASASGGIECISSSPTISNCRIINNTDGGGILCYYSSPKITYCTIAGNSANYGGGIYCLDSSGPTITGCAISGNSARYGGGIYCRDSSPIITSSTITGNSADRGGGIYCEERSSPIIINCTIAGNTSRYNGGICCYSDSSPMITNCAITGNSAANNGGGLFGCNGPITNCIIIGNSAKYSGGGLAYCSGLIKNCTITGNSADYGGGIYCYYRSPTITNCTISGNSAKHGGGIYCSYSSPTIINCNITDNSAVHGGGIYGCGGPVTNCIIANNSAKYTGGGLMNCNGSIKNCTITGNSAGEAGGLIFCDGPIKNCIITGNSAEYGGGLCYCNGLITLCTISDNSAIKYGGGLYGCRGPIANCIIWGNWPEQILGRPITITHSDVQGSYPGLGNNNADPCFIEHGYWVDVNDPNIIVDPNDPNVVWLDGDYHLLPTSPCINAGDPNYVPEPNETDLDGLPRIIGGRIDMGAYEFNHQPVADAGPNQTIYAWIDGFADVNLDGSGSYDDDNDVLDYYWSWTIDGNTYEANGVNLTIELPIGIRTIELVVDDGIDFSDPDYCIITVVKAVRGRLMLSPRVIETRSHGKWIIATLFILPVPGEKVNSTVPLRLYPSGIEAKYQHFFKYGRFGCSPTLAIAFFDKQQVIDALGTGRFEVDVVGQFLSGRFFFGSDTIKIITHKPPPNHWHW